MTTILQFKHSKDSSRTGEVFNSQVGGIVSGAAAYENKDSDDENDDVVRKMKRELYAIPDHLDVDKIKQSRTACFADRTAVHIKNGLTEV